MRLQEVLVGKKESAKEINKLLQQGLIRKIAPRLYSSNLVDSPELIIRRNWYHLLSALYPQAFLSHRSALERKPTTEGHIYLTYSYNDKIVLPGLTIHFIKGHPAIEVEDTLFFGNLKASGLARAFLENIQSSRKLSETSKTFSRIELEEKIESFLRVKGEIALNQVRDKAKEIALMLGMQKEWEVLNKLITDMLGTGLSKNLKSDVAKARVLGEPIDPDRATLFELLYEDLINKDFPIYPEKNNTIQAYQNFAFFESYFSNYIEGTEFTIEEAKQIITSATPLPARDEDSHDVLGTYQLVADKNEMSITPKSANELIELIKFRHSILLSARIPKMPGEFKDRNNRAGSTEFVDWQLVIGTLKKGFEWYSLLQHPFARAAYMMFMISEVHPFLDGNGRIARVMMNAELSSNGLSKIIIPTVYREDYMGTLKKLTKQRDTAAYIKMLSRAWEFSSNIYDEILLDMEAYLTNCNSFLSHKEGYLKLIAR